MNSDQRPDSRRARRTRSPADPSGPQAPDRQAPGESQGGPGESVAPQPGPLKSEPGAGAAAPKGQAAAGMPPAELPFGASIPGFAPIQAPGEPVAERPSSAARSASEPTGEPTKASRPAPQRPATRPPPTREATDGRGAADAVQSTESKAPDRRTEGQAERRSGSWSSRSRASGGPARPVHGEPGQGQSTDAEPPAAERDPAPDSRKERPRTERLPRRAETRGASTHGPSGPDDQRALDADGDQGTEARAGSQAAIQRPPADSAGRAPSGPRSLPLPNPLARPGKRGALGEGAVAGQPIAARTPAPFEEPAPRPKQPSASPRLESRAGVLHFKGLKLSAFQLAAVRAVEAGKNVLVSAPTGAGKTLVAEYAIADAVARGRRCIYTAPIKALSNQKYRDFRDDPAIDVGLMTGDVTIHPRAQVLIMTTEILRNSIFEDPRNLADVEYVIFDEVHYMDDAERGTVWEESLIFAPTNIRFICLSATVANLDELGRWLGEIREQPLEIVRSDRRPVPLEFEFFTAEAGRFPARKLGDVQRRTPRIERGRGRRGPGGRPPRDEGHDFRLLLDDLESSGLLPALVFSFSRKDCERLALQNRRRQLLNEEQQAQMRAAQKQLIESFQLDPGELEGEVFRLASRGLGYHHAGMLPVHKEVIERLFTAGLIKLLFTTETFAVGINMPARTAAFYGLKKFDGQSFDYLRTRDFMQMAGRAGRQGIDEQGLVVVRLEPRDLEDAPLERLLSGKPEPVQSRFRLSYSSILHLLERLGRQRLHEAWEKSFNQFQHRGSNKKTRERNRLEQRRLLEAHLALLAGLGYIEADDSLTAKGKIARLLYGYELQITELIFSGALERLPAEGLAMVFVALVHESRRRFGENYVSPRIYGPERRELDRIVGHLVNEEARHRIPMALKTFDWGLTPAVLAWASGTPLTGLADVTEATPGDLVRTFRMAVQLVRLLRRALDPKYDLVDRLEEVVLALNRDEVDARRQLELG